MKEFTIDILTGEKRTEGPFDAETVRARMKALSDSGLLFGQDYDVNEFTGTDFDKRLLKVGMTKTSLARLLGITRQAVIHWKSGRRKTPVYIDIILGLIESGKLTVADIEEIRKTHLVPR